MAKIKLTGRERQYYRKLFQEDRNYYTVVDQLSQLPMLAGKFEGTAETLGFIEFLSDIFHIVWAADVYDRNHRRLMDILIGFQYAIEFEKDKEAAETMEMIIDRFKAIFSTAETRTDERVRSVHNNLVADHRDRIPESAILEEETAFFLRLSRPYILQYAEELLAGEAPAWPVRNRRGISLEPLTYEAIHIDVEERGAALSDHLGL